jgi:hypothetical protein
VELDYLLDLEVCFSHAWTPFHNGGCGGAFPHTTFPGGPRGGRDNFCSPPCGDSGYAPEGNFGKRFLVKYCNFVVNLDRSL